MSQRLDAIAVAEYTDRSGERKTRFTRIGSAFATQNGGYAVVFDALPTPSIDKDGKLVTKMLLMPPRDDAQQFGGNGRQQQPRGGQRSRQPGDDDIPDFG